jgi:hypothetical protein
MHADSDDTATWLRDPANRQLLSSPLSVAELLKQGALFYFRTRTPTHRTRTTILLSN